MYPHDVIEVEKTVSPYTLLGAPNDLPENFSPVLRCRMALPLETWDAKPLERRTNVDGLSV